MPLKRDILFLRVRILDLTEFVSVTKFEFKNYTDSPCQLIDNYVKQRLWYPAIGH